jgi:hypothetical protein
MDNEFIIQKQQVSPISCMPLSLEYCYKMLGLGVFTFSEKCFSHMIENRIIKLCIYAVL